MTDKKKMTEAFLKEVNKLHEKLELSKTMTADYYEPGMMEYPDQYEGLYNEIDKTVLIRFDVKGTRYEGRTELIEKIKTDSPVKIVREKNNAYNANNFAVVTVSNKSLGNMPAVLCNTIAPLYDAELLTIEKSKVSFTDPISKRGRYAK